MKTGKFFRSSLGSVKDIFQGSSVDSISRTKEDAIYKENVPIAGCESRRECARTQDTEGHPEVPGRGGRPPYLPQRRLCARPLHPDPGYARQNPIAAGTVRVRSLEAQHGIDSSV